MSIFTVPNNFADKCSDSSTFLLDSVIANAFSHVCKHLTYDVKFDIGKVVLLNYCFEFGEAFSQRFAFFVKFINLLYNVFFGISAFRFSERNNEGFNVFFIIFDLESEFG